MRLMQTGFQRLDPRLAIGDRLRGQVAGLGNTRRGRRDGRFGGGQRGRRRRLSVRRRL